MQTSFSDKVSNWSRNSTILKLMVIGFLFLILMIPQNMVSSLIQERENVRNEATTEVSSKWGGTQTLSAPVITIPYKYTEKDDKGFLQNMIGYAHFFPEKNTVKTTIQPEKRYRGIYMIVLYNAMMQIQGDFAYPALEELDIPTSDLMLEDAYITLGISDLKGLKDPIQFKLNETTYEPNPGLPTKSLFPSGLSFKIKLDPSVKNYVYSYTLNLNGSTSIDFLPFAKENMVSMDSKWGSPSFQGDFLPEARNVTSNGFTAQWKVLHLNRNYPQAGLDNFISEEDNRIFGVKLMLPVDEYNKITRSIKYCSMLILLTFLTFFFIEIINKRRIHSIQYLLVGFALIIFYILLLSLSEHLKFDSAYLIGSLATIGLLAFYTYYVFNNRKLTLVFVSLLSLMYLFFYSLLQMEDYALLMGSIGLFIILASIMYLTRKIDWYNINQEG